MQKKSFRILEVFGGMAVGALLVIIGYALMPNNLKAALPIFHRAPEQIDIALTDVQIRKVAEASSATRHSSYVADLKIKNLGTPLNKAMLVISSGIDRSDVKISTKKHEFSLGYNDEIVVNGYNVLMDKNYNGEMIKFEVSIDGYEESILENNVFTKGVVDFENPGLSDVLITNVQDGVLSLTPPLNLGKDFNYEILHSKRVDSFPNKVFSYRELMYGDEILSYYVAPVDIADMETLKGFSQVDIDPLNPTIAFSTNVYNDHNPHIFAIKASRDDKTVYAFSNLVVLPVQQFMNRAEFAKLLIESLEIPLEQDTQIDFLDVEDHWYTPYVNTLLNKGFIELEKEFYPDEIATRGYVVKVLAEASDLPFKIQDGKVHFEDVDRENPYFYAIEALFADGKLDDFGHLFKPDYAATRAFLHFFLKQK